MFRVDETLDSPTTHKNNAKSIDFTMKIKNIKFSTISPLPAGGPGRCPNRARGRRRAKSTKINRENQLLRILRDSHPKQRNPGGPGSTRKTLPGIPTNLCQSTRNHCKNNGLRTAYVNNIEKTMFSGVIED